MAQSYMVPDAAPANLGRTPDAPAQTLAGLLLDGSLAVDLAAAAAIRSARGDDAVPSDALLLLADAFDTQAASFEVLAAEADRGCASRRADALDAAAWTLRRNAARLRDAAPAIADRPLRLPSGE